MSNHKYKLSVIFGLVIFLLFTILVVAAESSEEIGHWRIDKEVDPLTDELEILLSLPSNESIDTYTFRHKALIIRFSEATAELFISWDEYLADNTDILYRFDNGEVEENTWNKSKDGTALFFPRRKNDLERFVERLIEADKFIVGITPYNKKRQTAVFDVRGLGKALLPHLEHFGWEELEDTIEEKGEYE